MASQVEIAKCVLWFHVKNSLIMAERIFRTAFGKDEPSKTKIITFQQNEDLWKSECLTPRILNIYFTERVPVRVTI
jgi:hypothetical protein